MTESYEPITTEDIDAFVQQLKKLNWKKQDSNNKVIYEYEISFYQKRNKGLRLVSILLQDTSPRKGARGEYFCGAASDKYPCILKLLDWHETDWRGKAIEGTIEPDKMGNKLLFDELDKAGFQEANNKHCAQWGTWKFIINTKEDLDKIAKIIKKNF